MKADPQTSRWPNLPSVRELSAESWRLQREAMLMRLLSRTLARIERERFRITAETDSIRHGGNSTSQSAA